MLAIALELLNASERLPAEWEVNAVDKWSFALGSLDSKVEVNDISDNSAITDISTVYKLGYLNTYIDPVKKVVKTPIFFFVERFKLMTTGMGM